MTGLGKLAIATVLAALLPLGVPAVASAGVTPGNGTSRSVEYAKTVVLATGAIVVGCGSPGVMQC